MGYASRLRLVKPPESEPTVEQIEVDTAQLQLYADRIGSQAEWDRLLASAPTSYQRAELERLIGPLLRFRYPRCCTPDCESGLPPVYQPVLIVRHLAWGDPMYAPIERRYCATCKDAMRVSDLLSTDIWAQICAKCDESGEPVPTRILTQLTFDRLDRTM